MIEPLAAATTAAALLTALAVAAAAAAGRYRWVPTAAVLLVLELALLVDAVVDVAGLARGHDPREPVVHLAYLGVSVGVLPLAATQASGDDGRWSAALVVAALLVLAVVVVRAQTTWRAA